MQQGLFDKPRAVIRETRILECWCPKCHQGQIKTILNDGFGNDRNIIESVGREFKCANCGIVYEVGDFLSVIPNAFMVASRSEQSKAKSNMEVEAWLNEPVVKDEGNYDGDAIMKDLELLNRSAEVTNRFLENMLSKINKPTDQPAPAIERQDEYQIEEPEVSGTTSEAQAILKQCVVHENVVKLPDGQLDRKLYAEVKKALELIGGKWKGGKTYGFVFQSDPTELLEQVANGEKRNLKKEFQFFATPTDLAARMVDMAELSENDGRGFGRILEPSAGQGAIVNAIHDATGGTTVICYELMDINRDILKKIKGASLIGDDFMKADRSSTYDRIIANPPFTKNQDIDHIRLMYELLAPGGVMVTLSSISWTFGSIKKQVQFREWLDEVGAYTEEIPENTFKESGTSIKTMLIKIKKR